MLRDDSVRFEERADVLLGRIAEFTAEHLEGRSGDKHELTIRRVGWAGYVVTTDRGTKVLVDPCQSGSEGFHSGLLESPITPESLTDVDIVVVTHAGYDHRGQAIEIALAANVLLVCGSAMLKPALAAGIPLERIALTVSGVRCGTKMCTSGRCRPGTSQHGRRRRVLRRPAESFLLRTADGSTVFCGGDSSLSEDMRTGGVVRTNRYYPGVSSEFDDQDDIADDIGDELASAGQDDGPRALPRGIRPLLVLGKIRQIIEVFAPDRPELTFLEIRKATGLPASTCQRLVANMVAEQFLDRHGDRYRIGLRFGYWASPAGAGMDVSEVVRPALEWLRDATGETSCLYRREGDVRVCVAMAETYHAIRREMYVGKLMPLHAGSASRVLLAWDESEVDDMLERPLVS